MKKKFLLSYFSILFFLLAVMSLSTQTTEKLKGTIIALFSPLWKGVIELTGRSKETPYVEKINELELENQLLKNTIAYLSQTQGVQIEDSKKIPSRVIFRSPESWGSSLWIDKGYEDNHSPDFPIIAKNSPVLLGNSVVGILDYVGKKQSRVRLITDSRLTPSVRAVRGGEQDAFLAEHTAFLIKSLQDRQQAIIPKNEQEQLKKLLWQLQVNIQSEKKFWYLAKGELQGSSLPLWRCKSNVLRGTGFNYDFPDEKGGARDLRTGKAVNDADSEAIPLLKTNDLLITTGMDGIFPEGLRVAVVTRIELLKEGDYCYELEAQPTAGNLNDLSLLFIIPPLMRTDDEEGLIVRKR